MTRPTTQRGRTADIGERPASDPQTDPGRLDQLRALVNGDGDPDTTADAALLYGLINSHKLGPAVCWIVSRIRDIPTDGLIELDKAIVAETKRRSKA